MISMSTAIDGNSATVGKFDLSRLMDMAMNPEVGLRDQVVEMRGIGGIGLCGNLIAQTAKSYQHGVGLAVGQAMNKSGAHKKMLDVVVQDASSHGWMHAGVWFFQLAKISSETSRIMSWKPRMGGKMLDNHSAIADITKTGYDLDDQLKTMNFGKVNSPDGIFEMLSNLFIRKILGVDDNLSAKTVMGLGHLFGYSDSNYRHPLVQLQESGQNLIGVAMVAKLLNAHVSAVGDGIKAAGNGVPGFSWLTGPAASYVGKIISSFSDFTAYLILALFGVGIVKAFILPLLPFFKWLKQSILFLITVIEVLVATPLWIAFHMHPDGEDISSEKAKVGYGMLLEAALRPILLVFALLFAFMLMEPAVMFAHHAFAISIGAILSDFGITTLVGIVVLVIMYCAMIYTVIDKCCDVIDILPAKVLNWVALKGHSDHGDFEKNMMAVGGVIKNDAKAGLAKKAGKDTQITTAIPNKETPPGDRT